MKRFLLLLSALIPLLGLLDIPPDPALLVYTFFTTLYFFRHRLPKYRSYTAYIVIGIVIGLFSEIVFWLGNFLECNGNPALLHPQLLADLLLAVGFYGSWGIAWLILFKKYKFSLQQIFITQGVYGIFIEQKGQLFLQGLSTFPVGAIFWLYVFLVYGSIAGSTVLFTELVGSKDTKWKYVVAIMLLFFSSLIVTNVWGGILSVILPEPGLICQRPLW